MKILFFPLCFLSSFLALSQATKVGGLPTNTRDFNSSLQKTLSRTDSLESKLKVPTDSLKLAYRNQLVKVDSITGSFHHKRDSLQRALQSKLTVLNSTSSTLQHKVDSLKSLKIPTEKYTHKLDSLNQVRESTIASANKNIQSLKAQTTDKLKTIKLPLELQSKVTDVTKNIDGFKIPGQDLNLSSLDLPDYPLSKMDNINLSSVNKIDDASNLGKLPEAGELKDFQGNMKDVTKATGEIGSYQKDIQNVSSGNLNKVKEMPKTLETKAADVSGIGGLQNETKALDQYKDQLGKVQNPDALKKEAVNQVQKEAINHFAGREHVLQNAMDKMSKYKQKYSSLQSLNEAGKKRPNEMRGKPLKERLLPSLGLQMLRKNDLLFDFSPYLGYRISGKWNSGIGWNQRVAYDDRRHSFHAGNRAFGPRLFSEVNLYKGFFPRIELETMNAYVPALLSQVDAGHRQWVWSAFAGLKKNYKFLKHVNGYTVIMVNLYNPLHKSPYGDVVSMRIGFEFPMKKKQTDVK